MVIFSLRPLPLGWEYFSHNPGCLKNFLGRLEPLWFPHSLIPATTLTGIPIIESPSEKERACKGFTEYPCGVCVTHSSVLDFRALWTPSGSGSLAVLRYRLHVEGTLSYPAVAG